MKGAKAGVSLGFIVLLLVAYLGSMGCGGDPNGNGHEPVSYAQVESAFREGRHFEVIDKSLRLLKAPVIDPQNPPLDPQYAPMLIRMATFSTLEAALYTRAAYDFDELLFDDFCDRIEFLQELECLGFTPSEFEAVRQFLRAYADTQDWDVDDWMQSAEGAGYFSVSESDNGSICFSPIDSDQQPKSVPVTPPGSWEGNDSFLTGFASGKGVNSLDLNRQVRKQGALCFEHQGGAWEFDNSRFLRDLGGPLTELLNEIRGRAKEYPEIAEVVDLYALCAAQAAGMDELFDAIVEEAPPNLSQLSREMESEDWESQIYFDPASRSLALSILFGQGRIEARELIEILAEVQSTLELRLPLLQLFNVADQLDETDYLKLLGLVKHFKPPVLKKYGPSLVIKAAQHGIKVSGDYVFLNQILELEGAGYPIAGMENLRKLCQHSNSLVLDCKELQAKNSSDLEDRPGGGNEQ